MSAQRFIRRHPTLATVVDSARVWWSDWQLFSAFWFLAVYLVLHMPGIRTYVPDWFDLNFLLPIVLLLILWQTVEITRRLEHVESGIRGISGGIESTLLESIEKTSSRHRTLDVLGLNLRYGWQGPRRWIDDGRMNGWTINLCAYVPNATHTWVPASWPAESERNLLDAQVFAKKSSVRKHSIKITTYAYTHAPPVHGYRLGNGDILVAYVGWEKGKLTGARARYEIIPRRDKSPHAVAMRNFFTAWLEAAKAAPYSPSGPDTSSSSTHDLKPGRSRPARQP